MEDLGFFWHVEDFESLSLFYKDILPYFHELKTLYGCDMVDTLLFNYEEICIEGKTFFWKGCFTKGTKRIENLLDERGQALPFHIFQQKCLLKKTSFLHYY